MGDEQENLPETLFRKIKEGLILYFDETGFFCHKRSLLPKIPNRTRIQLPWLLLPSKFGEASHEFFDMVHNETHYLDLHKTELYFRGSSYGWVVAMIKDSPDINLINPITGLHKQLPPRSKFPDVKECSPGNYVVWTTPCTGNYIKQFCGSIHARDFLTTKYILSSNPSFSDDFLAIAIYGQFSRLAYTKYGDDKWTSIQSEEFYSDIIFYKGKLYALTETTELMVVQIPEVTQITSSSRIPKPDRNLYLVVSSIGLLMVERILESRESEDNPNTWAMKACGFYVYKFDFGLRRWSNSLADIGDDSLFFGSNCSMSVSLDDRPMKFKGNSIYFTDNFLTLSCDGREERRYFDMGVFDMKTGRIEALPASKCPIHILWPLPIWVTPTIN